MFSAAIIRIKRTHKDAQLPTRAYNNAACWDVYCVSDIYIAPWQGAMVPVGVAIQLPKGWMAQIYTRSGHGFRGMRAHLGIIDEDYRGDISPFMMNHTPQLVQFKKGDRVAQIFFMPVPKTRIVETKRLSETKRGIKGHGSSGK
jgi:dUTP pyrophosphatase